MASWGDDHEGWRWRLGFPSPAITDLCTLPTLQGAFLLLGRSLERLWVETIIVSHSQSGLR